MQGLEWQTHQAFHGRQGTMSANKRHILDGATVGLGTKQLKHITMSASQHESNEDFTNVETHESGPFPMRSVACFEVGYLASSFFRKTNTNKYELVTATMSKTPKNGKPQSGTSISRRQYYLDDCSPRRRPPSLLYYLTTISVSRFWQLTICGVAPA